jgi:hypothetical protein
VKLLHETHKYRLMRKRFLSRKSEQWWTLKLEFHSETFFSAFSTCMSNMNIFFGTSELRRATNVPLTLTMNHPLVLLAHSHSIPSIIIIIIILILSRFTKTKYFPSFHLFTCTHDEGAWAQWEKINQMNSFKKEISFISFFFHHQEVDGVSYDKV